MPQLQDAVQPQLELGLRDWPLARHGTSVHPFFTFSAMIRSATWSASSLLRAVRNVRSSGVFLSGL